MVDGPCAARVSVHYVRSPGLASGNMIPIRAGAGERDCWRYARTNARSWFSNTLGGAATDGSPEGPGRGWVRADG